MTITTIQTILINTIKDTIENKFLEKKLNIFEKLTQIEYFIRFLIYFHFVI